MAISKSFVNAVREQIAARPDIRLNELALDLGANEATVITSLPVRMRQKARLSAFEAIWKSMAQWKPLGAAWAGRDRRQITPRDGEGLETLIGQPAASLAASGAAGALPLREKTGFIWFMAVPLSGGIRRSICFLDTAGDHLLSVSLAEDASGLPDPAQLLDYDALKRRFGVTPVPKIRCRGCAQCSCHAATGTD